MKTAIVYCIAGAKPVMLVFLVENPPVEVVDREWHTASKPPMPKR